MKTNEQIILVSRPKGMPVKENFRFVETTLPEVNEGQVRVRTLYLSVDPYMRGRMNEGKSYVPPFILEEVIAGGAVGQVEESKHQNLKAGDFVSGQWGWQTYTVADGSKLMKIDPERAPITTALSVLGMTGLTAYFGLLDIGKPQTGETVVVSGAAGAVGMVVGQIAKLYDCRVVGIAGSDEKISYLKDELGFDEGVNYKKDGLPKSLADACPNGVDIYFDNVGGIVSDVVMQLINKGARIPLCGQISLYNQEQPDTGPRVQNQLLINSALMQGFIIGNYAQRFQEGVSKLTEWVAAKQIQYTETVVEGFENTPQAFLGLFSGENTGKALVKVADPEW
jgi:NADPH-dependent curcumin reductase CurA